MLNQLCNRFVLKHYVFQLNSNYLRHGMAQPSPPEHDMEWLQKTKPEGIKPWFPGSNVYVLRLQNYQLNITSHMKVHKITDDPDCVLCENTTGQ